MPLPHRRRSNRTRWGVCLCLVFGAPAWSSSARAQATRTAQIEQQQAEKATRLHPTEQSRTQALIRRIERSFQGPPRGWYPWFGSVYRGGLFALGPGYRVPFGDSGALDAQIAVSLKGYTFGRVILKAPAIADGRVKVTINADTLNANDVGFFGVGNETREDDRTSFDFRPTTVGATVVATPARHIEVGASLSYIDIHTGPGTRGTPTQDRYSESQVPGLRASPTYLRSQAHAAFDWRDSAGYARHGGLYRVDWSTHDDRSGGAFSFREVDADIRQLIPLLRENWILALRASASTTSTNADAQVPFFLMPQLGGGADLRGYHSWRFRDRHRLLLTGEFRWTPSHFLDMAIFHDAGKVAAERRDLDLRDLTHSTGVGLRFHTLSSTFLRVEVAHGGEGTVVIMGMGQDF